MNRWKIAAAVENVVCHFDVFSTFLYVLRPLVFIKVCSLLSSDGILGVGPDQTCYFYQPRVPLRLPGVWWQQLWLHTDITSSTGCPNVLWVEKQNLTPRRGSDLWADCPLSSWMLRSPFVAELQ